jgi:hypothetical protein
MVRYNKIRESIAEVQHIAWERWSKTIAEELEYIKTLCQRQWTGSAVDKIDDILDRWSKNWKPYKKLSETAKDSDRVWADKVLEYVPIRCPVYQCGGFMQTVERNYPKGMTEDDFPDGMAGDFQLPDLVCQNCKALYQFKKFKVRKCKKKKSK